MVFRIHSLGHEGDDGEEEVLAEIITELDEAYRIKYERELAEAHQDLNTSTLTLQLIADEIRCVQQDAARKWEKDVRSLREQMSSSQKRIFLLEQEKEQLMRTATAAEVMTSSLNGALSKLSEENLVLRQRQEDLTREVLVLRRASEERPDVSKPMAAKGRALVSIHTQTDGVETEDLAAELTVEQMERQLSAMGQWLRQGVQLMGNASGQHLDGTAFARKMLEYQVAAASLSQDESVLA